MFVQHRLTDCGEGKIGGPVWDLSVSVGVPRLCEARNIVESRHWCAERRDERQPFHEVIDRLLELGARIGSLPLIADMSREGLHRLRRVVHL